jgi:uncharacterized protein (DUF58 family)
VATGAAELGALLDALRGARWPARTAAPAGAAGTHRSGLRGLSSEFTEYRPYRQGDDPRRLDWKLLARTDRAFLRITSERAVMGTLLLVDASRSMEYPAPGRSKWRAATLVALGLAAVAHAAGDPVGVVVPAARGGFSTRPRTRRGVLSDIARVLLAATPRHDEPLSGALRAIRTRRVVVISDFLCDDLSLLIRAARELAAAGADVNAVHVVAREELDPPAGSFLAVDPEHDRVRRPFGAGALAGYRLAFDEWRLDTARAFRAAGSTFTEVITDEPAAHAVRRVASAGAAPGRSAS